MFTQKIICKITWNFINPYCPFAQINFSLFFVKLLFYICLIHINMLQYQLTTENLAQNFVLRPNPRDKYELTLPYLT